MSNLRVDYIRQKLWGKMGGRIRLKLADLHVPSSHILSLETLDVPF